MIKYGAQEIIRADPDEDIESNIENILSHSVKRTKEIEKSLDTIESKLNLNNVSLTGEDEKTTYLYEFEGKDYKNAGAVPKESSFIDIGQRERKPA